MKTKTCNKCQTAKPLDQFHKSQRGKSGQRWGDGYRCVCKACANAKQLAWLASLPDERRRAIRKRHNQKTREWDRRNPHAVKASKANLHAKRVGASGRVSAKDVEAAWKQWGGKCWVCGFLATELDHYRPINGNGGGANTADNIRPICRECNQKRSHKWHGDEIAVKEAALLKRVKSLLTEAEDM
jgi:5-methylcytosine-specific restriction endonuclease McrA